MPEPIPIYCSDGEWKAVLYEGHLFDTMGEWVGWLDGNEVYALDGEYVGYISQDQRLLRKRILPYRKRRHRIPPRPPRPQVPASVPLAPLFAELPYGIIDVFEEKPNIFALVSELRPDAGEAPLTRLVDVNPQLASQKKLQTVKQELLEEMTYGIIYSYGVTAPPVPVEAMAAGRAPQDVKGIRPEFPYQRVLLAERLIEQLGHSTWALERGYCDPQGFTPAQVQYAARALLLPRPWLRRTSEASRDAKTLARRYLVPEEAATLRLYDLLEN